MPTFVGRIVQFANARPKLRILGVLSTAFEEGRHFEHLTLLVLRAKPSFPAALVFAQ